MPMERPTREQALGLLRQFNQSEALYAVDELTGLVAATAMVRPSKSILDMEPKSVKKKWKEKSFAAGVNREVIEKGAVLLGVDLNELIGAAIGGMREVADQIGLAGDAGKGVRQA